MQTLTLSEILTRTSAISKAEKIKFLRANATIPLLAMLRVMIDTEIKPMDLSVMPAWKPDGAPLGANPQTCWNTARLLYIFLQNFQLDENRRRAKLVQTLETMHEQECRLYMATLQQKPDVYGLYRDLIIEAFPNILTAPEVCSFLKVPPTFTTNQDTKKVTAKK